MMKEPSKITTYLSITLLLAVIILPSCIAFAKNPTEWPYGGIPDSLRINSMDPEVIPITFNKRVDLSDTLLSNNIDLGYAHFLDTSDFKNTHFKGYARFSKSIFDNNAIFYSTLFSKNADFSYAVFAHKAIFAFSHFSNKADFINTEFFDCSFSRAQFSNNADFSYAKFKHLSLFLSSQFLGKANFSRAEFYGGVDFSNAQFSETADFSNAYFGHLADFTEARFSSEVDLENTLFSSSLDIAGTRFDKGIDLRRTNFGEKKIILDHHTLFPNGKLKISWEKLRQHLEMKFIIYDQDKYESAAIDKEKYLLTEILYHRLRDNYLSQNDRASADAVMFEMASKRSEYLKEPLWGFYGLFMGWGYKPLRFVISAFLLIVIPFAILWYIRFYHRVLPIFSEISDTQQIQIRNKPLLKKTFLKYIHFHISNHHIVSDSVNLPARILHVLHFSTAVLLSIRIKKEWINREDRAFLSWVIAEWVLGIALYITFAVLVKSYEFGYVKGLLGF